MNHPPFSEIHEVLYFAYGSNLSEAQMRERCPDSILGNRARLAGYHLAFGNRSSYRQGGVATILPSPNGDSVPGVLYHLSGTDLTELDRWEAFPRKYGRITVDVEDETGALWRALTYVLQDFYPNAPSTEYLEIIAEGYGRFGFDQDALVQALGAGTPQGAPDSGE